MIKRFIICLSIFNFHITAIFNTKPNLDSDNLLHFMNECWIFQFYENELDVLKSVIRFVDVSMRWINAGPKK